MRAIMDMESDGLIETVTKIHCICYRDIDTGVSKSIIDYNEIRRFLLQDSLTIIGHNIIRFDKPVLNKILNIDIKARCLDTLALSWYLYPMMKVHGLEVWGDILGIKKPEIADWSNLSVKDYIFRCSEDVRINYLLFEKQKAYLLEIYQGDIDRIMGYLSFKMECAREAEEQKWKLDVSKCYENLELFNKRKDEKFQALVEAMPLHKIYKKVEKPKVMQKKDNTLSAAGNRWMSHLIENNLPIDTEEPIKVLKEVVNGNPGSHEQLKEWLFSLGWIPDVYKPVKDEETGEVRRIPQVSLLDGTDVCESVKKLYEIKPELENIEQYFKIKHRIGILTGFLRDKDENDFLKAEIQGLTNTLRFKHTTIVNLPQIPKLYWKEVRECLIAPDDEHLLVGSDMSGLEDTTKQHYMYFYDAKYVTEMRTPGFDPHLDIAILAGMLTEDEVVDHKLYESTKGAQGTSHKSIRLKAKKVNFTAMYLAGPPKIAETAGIPLEEAKLLHSTYWKRNKAIKQVTNNTYYKLIGSQMWLYQPVSQFWYSLRYEKDRFSTLNQSTGVYCFDTWVRKVRAKGIKLIGQFHDEIIFTILKGQEEETIKLLKEAIDEVNAEIQLNVPLAISVDFGRSYADVH